MNRDEDEEKAILLTNLAGVYNFPLQPASLEMMVDALEDYEMYQLRLAVKDVLLHSKFMPSLAELTDAADRHYKPKLTSSGRRLTDEEAAIQRRWMDANDAADDDNPVHAEWAKVLEKLRKERQSS